MLEEHILVENNNKHWNSSYMTTAPAYQEEFESLFSQKYFPLWVWNCYH